MTFWDGTRWVPDAPATPAPRRGSRFAGAALEALLITGLIFGLIAGTALAAGKQSYGLDHVGFQVWQEPYALAEFEVTRAKADRNDVWVKAECLDEDGQQAIPGAQPYGLVRWDPADPLRGQVALDSVRNGSTCEVWVARSFKSADPAPGWPTLTLEVRW